MAEGRLMLRFMLPAFGLTGALLVLVAGSLSGRLGSSGSPELSQLTSRSPEAPTAQPLSDAQRPAFVSPGAEQQPNRQQAMPALSPRQVDTLQQQATALQQQLAQRSKELEQRTKELQQRTRDAQAAQAEADRLKQQSVDAARQRQEDVARLSQLAARSAELDQRSQELEVRKRDLDKRSHDADAAQAEAVRLRQVVDAIRQQGRAEPVTVTRQKTDEGPVARQKAKQQQTAAPSTQEPPSPGRPPDAAVPAQQLMTARQWLAAGRPDEARRLLTAAQPQMVLQPVTPDAPDAQGASVPATDIGNAIRWLDIGANQQAMQAINHALEAAGQPVGRVRAWSGYQAYSSTGYSQPFTPR
jgi:hypothetical protein